MKFQKPLRVKVVIVMTTLKLAFMLLTIVLFYFTKDLEPGARNAMTGIRDGIIEGYGLNYNDLNYAFGKLIGRSIFPLIFAGLTLYFITLRKFWPTIVAVILDILTGFSLGIPLFTILILIVLLTKPARNYLKGIQPETASDILDEGL